MRIALPLASFVVVAVFTACPPAAPAGGGEGEGEGVAGEGEGSVAGEGEGSVAGEGEGGVAGEGEGVAGEGEGGAAGEGEGEGTSVGSGQIGDECDQGPNTACAAGIACGFDTSGGFLDEKCEATPTGLQTGAACNTSQADACAFHLCLGTSNGGGLCSAPCITDGDCNVNQNCGASSVTVDGVGGVAHVCVAKSGGPATPCHHDADCTALGLVCDDAVQSGQDVTLQCGAAGTGGNLGDHCGSQGIADASQCITGLCDGHTNGACTEACTTSGDCGGNGFVCAGSGFSNVPDRMCLKACTSDAVCGTGRTCQLHDDPVTNLLDQVCSENDGTLTAGTNIGAGQQGQCLSGLAYNFTPAGGGAQQTVCSAICAGDGDCSAFTTSDASHTPSTKCSALNFGTPNGGTQSVSLCVNP